ncbi:protein C12orf4 homolog isoform X1 [Octopus sinensis]|uniref:Protein C12orf4 homolog isoform X1 n=1 Tax=Octopus sinensis TaxID=2607531 RepID=A0A7E6FTC8_9MOLL|nr:protein C12orf4 homolog isoform X1 [Octopus sinensis]
MRKIDILSRNMHRTIEKQFKFAYSNGASESTMCANITIPSSQKLESLVARLMKLNGLPCYVEDSLKNSLDSFICEETKNLYDLDGEAALNRVKSGEVSADDLVKKWTKAFTQEVKEFAKPEEVTNEQVFSEVYHTLIHSPALETLLNLEHSYAMDIENITQNRDEDIAHLENKQQKEMEDALQKAGTVYTDEQINQIAQHHFEQTQVVNSKWASELSNRHETQKREYRNWVMKVHEDTQATVGSPHPVRRVRAMTASALPEAEEDERIGRSRIRLEESFTIHLGAQMKTTHNLRLVCTDILDLCRHKPHTVGGVIIPEPQRLQTAMSLYSNNLCGLVFLVDNRLNSYTGIKREFARVCDQATDFHFLDLEQQFALIESQISLANDWSMLRKSSDPEAVESTSVKSFGSSNSDGQDKTSKLQTGDVYITKHSNLSEVHVMFHLVVDDSVRSPEITSRHPTILSLRNILKVCFRYDILTLTIPLLLSHEMTEEMTVSWCLKRVELIFKCVKGFMMEMATWGGLESRTIQFLVPPGMSEEMFANISNMLPSIFRLSNPLVVKSV